MMSRPSSACERGPAGSSARFPFPAPRGLRESLDMSKRLITVLFASLAVLGLAAAPAQAADLRADVKIMKPMGWEWGI